MHYASLFLGGLGLFLLGMSLMTSGLKKLAGKRLHGWLGRVTRTPTKGVLTGAGMSAVIQSSSATILAAMGFVGAGLLTFAQGLGIVVGANIGTTLTGWMVAVLGLKLSFGTVALPLLSVAAFLYLFRTWRGLNGIGKSLAGFCLLFLGLDLLQESLGAFEGQIDLGAVVGHGISARLLALAIGVVFALVTQSSSATVAAALSALHTGVLDLPEAIAVIIGADVGTTATAALATIGARRVVRRTGFAHVIYNAITGVGAFSLLPLYLAFAETYLPRLQIDMPEVLAVAYHSLFNILGVLAVIPILPRFAAWIERIVPDEPDPWTGALDMRLTEDPHAARDTLRRSLSKICAKIQGQFSASLHGEYPVDFPREELAAALKTCRSFALACPLQNGSGHQVEAIHIIDHTERLLERLQDVEALPWHGLPYPVIADRLDGLRSATQQSAQSFANGEAPQMERLERLAQAFEIEEAIVRRQLVELAISGSLPPEELDLHMDQYRWIRRCAWHLWRSAHYWNAWAGEPEVG